MNRDHPSTLAVAVVVAAVLAAGASTSAAQTPACDRLGEAQRRLASEILASEHPYDCCDGTIAACLEREPVCRLAWRLADNVCRRVAEGQDADRIRRALSRRARSMLPAGPAAEIELAGVPVVGRDDAPVTMVVYVCARCPFCSKLVPKLHRAASEGPLVGKVRLYLKVFPIRSHPLSKEAGLAFLAAAQEGHFWDYMLHAYANFDEFSIDRQAAWAEAVGMDPAGFAARLEDPALREALVASKKEGLRNGVDATPAVFIDGRRFVGDLTLDELVDVVEEEHDGVLGLVHASTDRTAQPGKAHDE